MRFGTLLVYSGLSEPDYLAAAGELVEELGFDALWLADHVVVPLEYESRYPYSADGKLPVGATVPFPEPLVSLAYLAAVTSRVELGTGVLVLPERNPVLVAKQAATLDRLAGGRLRLGVGLGWLREEFEVMGVPFEERAARTDEHIDVMRALWREDEPVFDGRFNRFSGVGLRPAPVRADGVPIIVGGHAPASARRAGERGDGFFPFRFTIEELAPLFDATRRVAKDAGRDADAIELIAPTTSEPGWLDRLTELGVQQAVLPATSPSSDIETLKRKLGSFAERHIGRDR